MLSEHTNNTASLSLLTQSFTLLAYFLSEISGWQLQSADSYLLITIRATPVKWFSL